MKMLKNRKIIWMLGVFLVASCTSLYAQCARMVHLGDAHVDGAVDHDTIRVGRSQGKYRAIQLRVSSGAVRFDRVIVRYGNGTQEEIAVSDLIPAGGQTRIIDLPGLKSACAEFSGPEDLAATRHRQPATSVQPESSPGFAGSPSHSKEAS
jgi:hypothetical protein